MKKSKRLDKIPPYLFAQIDKIKAQKISEGVDIISLGIGDPDMPTPEGIVNELARAAKTHANHQYPSYEGILSFRKAVSDWYGRRFNVTLDPKNEVVTLIGSKEGIAHLPLAFVDAGDVVLVTDPGYPVYGISTLLAGGDIVRVPLLKENKFLPDFKKIPEDAAKKAKLMFVCYPNNPLAATASVEFFEELVAFAKKYDILIAHDAAYSEVSYDGYVCPSFLQAKGAKDVGIEFHSLSKTFNMTGWRIGFASGSKEAIEALGTIKTNVDSGVFQAVQEAGIYALEKCGDETKKQNKIYQERRDIVIDGLNSMGWKLEKTKATFYIWVDVPEGYTSTKFVTELLDKTGVLVVPGNGYGEHGEGYFRISITVATDRLREAMKRWREKGIHNK